MKIGISQDAYLRTTDIVTGVRKLADIGFTSLDFNFSDYCFQDSALAGDNWNKVISSMKNAGDECGIEFSQLHSPFYMEIDNHENNQFEEMMMMRSFEACQILGAQWAVIHPKRYQAGITRENYEQTKIFNIARTRKLCKQANEYGIGIALENFFKFSEELTDEGINQTSDMISIVDESNCHNLGVCLDTGHAFYAGIEPADAARQYGDRLKVLHVHDNDGKSDQHVCPFVGYIKWEKFMKALREISYKGAFSLEVHNYVQGMPKELIDDAIKLAYKIAKYLVSMIGSCKNESED